MLLGDFYSLLYPTDPLEAESASVSVFQWYEGNFNNIFYKNISMLWHTSILRVKKVFQDFVTFSGNEGTLDCIHSGSQSLLFVGLKTLETSWGSTEWQCLCFSTINLICISLNTINVQRSKNMKNWKKKQILLFFLKRLLNWYCCATYK